MEEPGNNEKKTIIINLDRNEKAYSFNAPTIQKFVELINHPLQEEKKETKETKQIIPVQDDQTIVTKNFHYSIESINKCDIINNNPVHNVNNDLQEKEIIRNEKLRNFIEKSVTPITILAFNTPQNNENLHGFQKTPKPLQTSCNFCSNSKHSSNTFISGTRNKERAMHNNQSYHVRLKSMEKSHNKSFDNSKHKMTLLHNNSGNNSIDIEENKLYQFPFEISKELEAANPNFVQKYDSITLPLENGKLTLHELLHDLRVKNSKLRQLLKNSECTLKSLEEKQDSLILKANKMDRILQLDQVSYDRATEYYKTLLQQKEKNNALYITNQEKISDLKVKNQIASDLKNKYDAILKKIMSNKKFKLIYLNQKHKNIKSSFPLNKKNRPKSVNK